jgi:competence protein ComEA
MPGAARAESLRGYVLLSLVWLVVVGVVWFVARRPTPQPMLITPVSTSTPAPTQRPSAIPPATTTPGPLRVDVAGAVLIPGVYRLPAGSIVADAIAAAGGPVPAADLDRINKATGLQDGMQIYVPRLEQGQIPTPLAPQPATVPDPHPVAPAERRSAAALTAATPAPLIDLNRATLEELDGLPGIGPALAQRIISGRPYATPEDLLHVPGIGPATLAKLMPFIEVQ